MLLNTLLFVLLVAALFYYPAYPSFGLDASWKMALGQFFHDGLQFGPEVIFTFGPLGFLYGNTYIGLPFWSLILWQLLVAAVFALMIMYSAQQLTGLHRIIYFGFFLYVGSSINDVLINALHQMIIVMIGFALIRRSGENWRLSTVLLVLFLALLASIKVTNLILASSVVLIACVHELLRGRWPIALRLASCFLVGFLALWMVCGQRLDNLLTYLYNSWHISQGYQQAMGLPAPGRLLWLGVTVLLVLSAYGLLYLILHLHTSSTLSRLVLLAVFMYLIWQQGFVRADGHMCIFFVSAFLPAVAFPALLDDTLRRRWPSQLLLVCAGFLCVLGLHSTSVHFGWPDMMWHAPSQLTDKLWRHYHLLGQWSSVRASYEHWLAKEKQQFDLPRTREVIGQASIDVLGFEQAIALYNGFTYRPRPVFQSYSAYTPYLARLNDAFYRSSQAPEYALLKLQTIDNRFPTLDDSLLLRSFIYLYDYVHTEGGFQLWKRRSQPLPEGRELPDARRSATVRLNQPFHLGELTHTRLWATLHVKPSFLGRLRNAVYKPPIIHLTIEDIQGRRSTFRLPLPQAATGFILNPLIEDSVEYVCFAMGSANRQVSALTLEVPEKYHKFFAATAHLELSALPSTPSGTACHEVSARVYFPMFQSYPTHYEALFVPEEVQVDGTAAVMLHAPSKLEFVVPEGATAVSGSFGFVEGAYTGSGETDGATFRIFWQASQQYVELYQRRLNPRHVPGDRGLQDFHVDLKRLSGGKLVLQADPGANSNWDWTAWTAIKIE